MQSSITGQHDDFAAVAPVPRAPGGDGDTGLVGVELGAELRV